MYIKKDKVKVFQIVFRLVRQINQALAGHLGVELNQILGPIKSKNGPLGPFFNLTKTGDQMRTESSTMSKRERAMRSSSANECRVVSA